MRSVLINACLSPHRFFQIKIVGVQSALSPKTEHFLAFRYNANQQRSFAKQNKNIHKKKNLWPVHKEFEAD